MVEVKHTPGPWAVDHNMGSGSYVRGAEDRLVASCYWMNGMKEMPAYANARLIAAAPDLLAALQGAIGALEFSRDFHSDLGNEEQAFAQDRLDAAISAIAKATGEATA